MSDKPLFRQAAIDRIASPERLDELMRLTAPRHWIALLVMAGLLAGVAAWSVFGSIPTRVTGQGILMRGGGLREIRAAGQGVLTALKVRINDTVDANEVIGEIAAGGVDETVRSARSEVDRAEREYARTKAEDEATIAGLRGTIAAQQADVARAQAQLDKAAEDLAAKREALAKGLITASRVQAIERDVLSLQANITSLRAAIANGQAGIRSVEQRIRGRADEVSAARSRLDEQKATATEITKVVSAVRGRVVEVKVNAGDRVRPGDVVAVVEPPSATLEPVVFVESVTGKRIKPGMEVEVVPSTVKREEYGFMLGRVRFVGDYPVTPEAVGAIVANSSLVQELLGGSAKLEMRASLVPDAKTPSGFRWSSSTGPPFKVDTGTRVIVSTVVERRPPIGYVLPLLRGTLGTR
jgi:HlyD family secretion protein